MRRRHSADKRRLGSRRGLLRPPNQFLPETGEGQETQNPLPSPARFDREYCTSVLSLSVCLGYQPRPERVTTALPCGRRNSTRRGLRPEHRVLPHPSTWTPLPRYGLLNTSLTFRGTGSSRRKPQTLPRLSMVFLKSFWSLDESPFPQGSRPCVDSPSPSRRVSTYNARNSVYLAAKCVPWPPANVFLSGWPVHSDLSYVEGHYAPFAVELFPP